MTLFANQNLTPENRGSTAPLLKPSRIMDPEDDDPWLEDFGLYLKRWGEPSRLTRGFNAMKGASEAVKDHTLWGMLGMQRVAQRRWRQIWSQARQVKLGSRQQ